MQYLKYIHITSSKNNTKTLQNYQISKLIDVCIEIYSTLHIFSAYSPTTYLLCNAKHPTFLINFLKTKNKFLYLKGIKTVKSMKIYNQKNNKLWLQYMHGSMWMFLWHPCKEIDFFRTFWLTKSINIGNPLIIIGLVFDFKKFFPYET